MVAEVFDAGLDTLIPLKQRDSSAAARLVKLTSADIPTELLLRQTARSPAMKQAVVDGDGPGGTTQRRQNYKTLH